MFYLSPPAVDSEGQVFETSVTIGPRSSLIFELTYEEVLQRRQGRYRHLVSLQPHMVPSAP